MASPLSAQTTLFVPRERVGEPMLFGSRIVDVNRPKGKMFASGQRNPWPELVRFKVSDGGRSLALISVDYTAKGGWKMYRHDQKHRFRAVEFPVLDTTGGGFTIDVSDYFSTYPVSISAVPPKLLPGRAVSHTIVDAGSSERYMHVTGHYNYSDGLDVTALCYLVYLSTTPMETRIVDPSYVAYNGAEFRTPGRRRVNLSQRWRLASDDSLVFYVDNAFPPDWFPYIKEGIEDWNKAFEMIGLGSPLVVYPLPKDGSVDMYSPLVNMVRYIDVEESNAKGDVLVDPRSGEILQGDILWWKNVLDLMCGWRYVQTGAADPAARQLEYPIEMLGPMIRHAICHEMGHVLGLGHNMGASWAYPSDSLRSITFTQEYGTTASVMDYARYNHLADAADYACGVNLMPPRLGPYDYYAIAMGYAPEKAVLGDYCYFAPFISAAISPDPSSQSESLGDNLIRSCMAGCANCRKLLTMDGLTDERLQLLKKNYYRYITLSLSNIGGTVKGVPVKSSLRRRTVAYVFLELNAVPPELFDARQQKHILDELTGNFLPARVKQNGGEAALQDYFRQVKKLKKKYKKLINQ